MDGIEKTTLWVRVNAGNGKTALDDVSNSMKGLSVPLAELYNCGTINKR